MNYLWAFVVAFVLSLVLVPAVKKFAARIGAIDQPVPNSRKIHSRPMPRAGGLVLYASFVLTSLVLLPTYTTAYWGLLGAVTIVMVVGLIDDVHSLNPWVKLSAQVAGAVVAIASGIKIATISNLSGGYVDLTIVGQAIRIGGLSISLSAVALAMSLLWLVGMTNTVNFLDGLDGLAAGVAGIAAVVMFLLSVGPHVNQPATALLAIILAGSCFGYLIHNFYPARIFNGDSGAYFLGMALGCLAIISGAKLATALLVLGLPILDAIWAVLRRLITGRSPFSADRGHIHFLLLDAGLSQTQAVLTIYAFSVAFGTVALISGTQTKLLALIILVGVTAALLTFLHVNHVRANPRGKTAKS